MIRLRNSIFLMLQFIVFSNVFAQTSPTMEESRKYQDCISKVEILRGAKLMSLKTIPMFEFRLSKCNI